MLLKAPDWFPAANNNDWIGYFGNLIGSLIGAASTIFVFNLTVNHSNRKDFNDRRMQVLPYLHLEIIGRSRRWKEGLEPAHIFSEDMDKGRAILHSNVSYKVNGYDSLALKIQNIGIGLATNVDINKFAQTKRIAIIENTQAIAQGSPYIKVGDSIEIFMIFPLIENERSVNELEIGFLDLLGNYYKQKVDLTLTSNSVRIRSYSEPELVKY
ncbi:hypothetical protein CFI03_006390 [Paenibacillus sp. ATY16]|nr:hypothetical protein [Paenibacillus sp. ATY16]